MGITAMYMMADDAALERFRAAELTDLADMVDGMEENEDAYPSFSLDKLWDGLHFLYTGVSAGNPVAGDALSEAVVGIVDFASQAGPDAPEESDFIAYILCSELGRIIKALQELNWPQLEKGFSPAAMRKKNLYPDIWRTEDKQELFAELRQASEDLLDFFQRARDANRHIIVSIL